MIENIEEKSLQKQEGGLINRIYIFFKKLFISSNKKTEEKIKNDSYDNSEKKSNEKYLNFSENIVTGVESEKIKLETIQEGLKIGTIKEEDLSEEDVAKLKQLYEVQIKELEISIANYKEKILEIKNKNKGGFNG